MSVPTWEQLATRASDIAASVMELHARLDEMDRRIAALSDRLETIDEAAD